MREVMKKVKDMAKTVKEVMTCDEVKSEMATSDDGFVDQDSWDGLKGVEKMSRGLYMWVRLRTEGEAKLVVGSLEEEDEMKLLNDFFSCCKCKKVSINPS